MSNKNFTLFNFSLSLSLSLSLLILFLVFVVRFLIVKFEGSHPGRQQLESSDREVFCLLLSGECCLALPDKLQAAGGVCSLLQPADQTELSEPL